MKEVEKVSLGGYAFTMEQDASQLAASYLGELESFYSGREGGSEVIEGIEERMAELLHEKCGREGVVSRADIERIIGILGRPEVIEEEDSPVKPANDGSGRSSSAASTSESKPRRKLYRDMTDKVVAGVCSGLGAYFNVDKALFRILFVLFTLLGLSVFKWNFHGHLNLSIHLFFPVLYAILWVCMPAAKTARQRWEQRGEDGTVLGIQQSIETGAREVGDAIKSVGQSKAWSEMGGVLGKLLGVILVIVGFSGLFASGVLGFGSGLFGGLVQHGGLFGLGQLYDDGIAELYHHAPSIATALAQPWIHVLIGLVVFLPFLGILYGGLQLLFGFKSPSWHPGLVIFVLWLLSLIATGILAFTGIVSTEWLTI
jgi:phage shock protein PspC (stress-responsive transcriptional regulator)